MNTVNDKLSLPEILPLGGKKNLLLTWNCFCSAKLKTNRLCQECMHWWMPEYEVIPCTQMQHKTFYMHLFFFSPKISHPWCLIVLHAPGSQAQFTRFPDFWNSLCSAEAWNLAIFTTHQTKSRTLLKTTAGERDRKKRWKCSSREASKNSTKN